MEKDLENKLLAKLKKLNINSWKLIKDEYQIFLKNLKIRIVETPTPGYDAQGRRTYNYMIEIYHKGKFMDCIDDEERITKMYRKIINRENRETEKIIKQSLKNYKI